MKLETVLPYAKIGIAVLAGVVGGSGATMAYKSTLSCPVVRVECTHPIPPPIKLELICPKK